MTSDKILHYRIGNFQKEDILFRYFEAQHTQFNKNLVLQILKNVTPDTQEALTSEIKLVAQLQHPNIVTLYDYILQDSPTTSPLTPKEGTNPEDKKIEVSPENLNSENNTTENIEKNTKKELYLITELIQGKSLHDILTKITGLLPEQKAIPIFLEILNAFSFACGKKDFGGAIHPEHIFILPNDQVKISYIALSEVYAQQALITENKELISYFAPERIRQEYYNINETTDVYILGVLLWQMLTGKNPYQGFNLNEIKLKILNENLPSPKSIYPAVSDNLVEVIAKATAKNQKDRFQSLKEMQNAILKGTNVAQEDEEEYDETVTQMEKRPFFNMPLIVTVLGLGWLSFLIWSFNNPEKIGTSEILFDLQNAKRIKLMQDSLRKVEAQKSVIDSIRHFENLKKKSDIPEDYVHKAGRDETIESIARRYYMPLDSVLKWNSFTGKEKLKYKDGVKVKIKHLYHLRKDETLGEVAQKYNVSEFILKDVNQIFAMVNSRGRPTLFEGKEIVIPVIMIKN